MSMGRTVGRSPGGAPESSAGRRVLREVVFGSSSETAPSQGKKPGQKLKTRPFGVVRAGRAYVAVAGPGDRGEPVITVMLPGES